MLGEPMDFNKWQMDFNKWQTYAKQILGNDFFANFVSAEGPQYDIYTNSSEMIVLVNIPYVRDLSQIHLKVRESELWLKGKVDLGFEHMQKVHKGIFSGDFQLTIPLPQTVNTKRINAQYQRGLLIIRLFPRNRRDGVPISIKES